WPSSPPCSPHRFYAVFRRGPPERGLPNPPAPRAWPPSRRLERLPHRLAVRTVSLRRAHLRGTQSRRLTAPRPAGHLSHLRDAGRRRTFFQSINGPASSRPLRPLRPPRQRRRPIKESRPRPLPPPTPQPQSRPLDDRRRNLLSCSLPRLHLVGLPLLPRR